MLQTPKMVLICKVCTNLKYIIFNFNNCNTSFKYLAFFRKKIILIKAGKKNLAGKNDDIMNPGGKLEAGTGSFSRRYIFWAGRWNFPRTGIKLYSVSYRAVPVIDNEQIKTLQKYNCPKYV